MHTIQSCDLRRFDHFDKVVGRLWIQDKKMCWECLWRLTILKSLVRESLVAHAAWCQIWRTKSWPTHALRPVKQTSRLRFAGGSNTWRWVNNRGHYFEYYEWARLNCYINWRFIPNYTAWKRKKDRWTSEAGIYIWKKFSYSRAISCSDTWTGTVYLVWKWLKPSMQ